MIGEHKNGCIREADFPFYKGEVGVQEYEDRMELAYFGRIPTINGSARGTLDGQPVEVISIRARHPSNPRAKVSGEQEAAINLLVLKQNK